MTPLTPATPRDTQSGPALAGILHYAIPAITRRHSAVELTVGTPEHAELVAAIMREFPEVYDTETRPCRAD
jgi:hypothetical protein